MKPVTSVTRTPSCEANMGAGRRKCLIRSAPRNDGGESGSRTADDLALSVSCRFQKPSRGALHAIARELGGIQEVTSSLFVPERTLYFSVHELTNRRRVEQRSVKRRGYLEVPIDITVDVLEFQNLSRFVVAYRDDGA